MTSFPTPPSTHRPEMSRGRRFRHGYQKLSFILLGVFAAFVFVLYLAFNSALLTGTQPRGSANAGQGAPGVSTDPNPVATLAPVQTAPLPPPSGLSPAKALDWRLVQWDKLTNNGQNEVVPAAQLNQTTTQWVSTINAWIDLLPHHSGPLAAQFGGKPWAADGVLANAGDPELYPKYRGTNPEIMVSNIGINGDGDGLAGSTVRFFYSTLSQAGLPDESRTFKLVWHVSSDGVGHPLVSICKGHPRRC